MLRSPAFGGVPNFLKLLEAKGFFLEEAPKTACQACFEIFSSSVKTKAIKDYFDAEMEKSMIRIVEAANMMSKIPERTAA